jgi:hypothetical protein
MCVSKPTWTPKCSLLRPEVSRLAAALTGPLLLASYTSTRGRPTAPLNGTSASRRCSGSAMRLQGEAARQVTSQLDPACCCRAASAAPAPGRKVA